MSRRKKTCSARIQPLALLPVFHRLTGAKVLLVGGGDGAAWKAELMLAAGARVVLFASGLSSSMEDLIHKHESSFDLQTGDWSPASFDGVRLAILETDCEVEAAAFVEAGRMSGVPVNVIDRPEFCQFQFGSIVNRSPAIVSISTDGAAPILGQAIRRRIEILLPSSLAGWTALAQGLRHRVNEKYAIGAPRRAFWENFVDRVFSDAEPNAHGLFDAPQSGGRIALVHAGPGDVDELTIKAMRTLQQADIIFFDRTVSPEILQLARREARRLQIASCNNIDAMFHLAQSGKTVVCLTSELTSLQIAAAQIARQNDHDIAVDIVAGPEVQVPNPPNRHHEHRVATSYSSSH